MPSDKLIYKAPEPRKFSGKGTDLEPVIFKAWRCQVKDYFRLRNVPVAEQFNILQYFLEDTALKHYLTKRNEDEEQLDPQKKLTIDQYLEELQSHLFHATSVTNIWNRFNSIKQGAQGHPSRIKDIAIKIEQIASELPGTHKISEFQKVHKLLDAMYPKLRLAVEPTVDYDNPKWKDTVETATRHDQTLHNAGEYKGTNIPKHANGIRTSAIQYTPKKDSPERRYNQISAAEKQRLIRENRCFKCKQTGHQARQCRSGYKNQQNQLRTQNYNRYKQPFGGTKHTATTLRTHRLPINKTEYS